MADKLNVLAMCGSLRKGSFNRMLMNTSIALAPEGMAIKEVGLAPMLIYKRGRSEFERASRLRPTHSPPRFAPPMACSSSRRNTTGRSPAA